MMMQHIIWMNIFPFFFHTLIDYNDMLDYEIIVRGVWSSPSAISSFFSLYKIKLLEPSSKSSSRIFSTTNSYMSFFSTLVILILFNMKKKNKEFRTSHYITIHNAMNLSYHHHATSESFWFHHNMINRLCKIHRFDLYEMVEYYSKIYLIEWVHRHDWIRYKIIVNRHWLECPIHYSYF